MGASNAMAAYVRYAGKVPALSMQVLAYMALVSRDADDRPWYGEGHHALAEHAMGRAKPNESDLRAVRRAVTPLIEAGALTVDRRGAVRADGPSTVRYRLHLKIGDIGRKPSGVEPSLFDEEDPPHRTESGPDVGQIWSSHRTKSGGTQDGKRPPKEPRGTKRSDKTEEESDDLRTAVTVAREDSTAPTPESSPQRSHPQPRPARCSHGLSAGLRIDGSPICAFCRRALPASDPPPPSDPEPDPPEPGGGPPGDVETDAHAPPIDGGTAPAGSPQPRLRLIRGAA